MRIGVSLTSGALFLLPLWNPVLVAEQVGTLATLAPGRFIVQAGLWLGSIRLGGARARAAGNGATDPTPYVPRPRRRCGARSRDSGQ
jgi:hypothetical protein